MTPADDILDALGDPATYTAPGGSPFAIMAMIRDADQLVRATRRTRLVGHQSEGSILERVGAVRGGQIQAGGAVYRIEEIVRASTPGLLDIGLRRVSGEPVSMAAPGDFADLILDALGRDVMIGDRPVLAQISRSGSVLREDGYGAAIEMFVVVVSVADADAVGVRPGDALTVDGVPMRAITVQRGGAGLTRISCE
jgi:hypothetical protein